MPWTTNSAAPLLALEARELIRCYQERFLTVLFTFQRADREQVKAIWEFMLQRQRGDDDSALAELIRQRTGEVVPAGTLMSKRHRLRQRLEVYRFFDERRPEDPDLHGDESLLQWIEVRRGLHDKDRPTLRKVAALARAVDSEKTLGWGLLARAVADTEQDRDELARIAQLLVRRSGWDPVEAERRWQIYRRWVSERHLREKISGWRGATKVANCGFLLPACWYLALLRGLGTAEIERILRPAGVAEVEQIRRIVGGCHE